MKVIARLLRFPGLSVTAMTSDGKSSPIKADDFRSAARSPLAGSRGRKALESRTAKGVGKSDMAVVEELQRRRLLRELESRKEQLLNKSTVPRMNSSIHAFPMSPHSSDSSSSSADSSSQTAAGCRASAVLRHSKAQSNLATGVLRAELVNALKVSGAEVVGGSGNGKEIHPGTGNVRRGVDSQALLPEFVRQQARLESVHSPTKGHSSKGPPNRCPPSRRLTPTTAAGHTIIGPSGGTRFVAVPVQPGMNPLIPVFTPSSVKSMVHQSRKQLLGKKQGDSRQASMLMDSMVGQSEQRDSKLRSAAHVLKSCLKKKSSSERITGPTVEQHNHHQAATPTNARSFLLNGSISVDENGIHRLSSLPTSSEASMGASSSTMANDPLMFPAHRSSADAANQNIQRNDPLLRRYRPIIPRQQKPVARTGPGQMAPMGAMMLVEKKPGGSAFNFLQLWLF